MKAKHTKPGETENGILAEIPEACIDETKAVEFIEKQRWGSQPACPHCGSIKVRKMTDGNGGRNKRFLWYCKDCKRQYSVRIGTVLEDSRIPLRVWCYAFWAACASKKGVSALQISRQCQISYKSALFLMHRVRYAMAGPKHEKKLSGIVEADETYCGGKPRMGSKQMHKDHRRGRGTKKTPVLALVERGGNVRAKVVPNVTAKTLGKIMPKEIHRSARVITDGYRSYRSIGRNFAGGHDIVRHDCGEYVRDGEIFTNTVESYFALLKRGLYGTFHAVSRKHLHRYVDEFAFRWNTRKTDDGKRIVAAIKGAEGKRLMYHEPNSKSA